MLPSAATPLDARAAAAGRARLAKPVIPAHTLPEVPGWLGRAFGRTRRYYLGVDASVLAQAKPLLQQMF